MTHEQKRDKLRAVLGRTMRAYRDRVTAQIVRDGGTFEEAANALRHLHGEHDARIDDDACLDVLIAQIEEQLNGR